MTPLQLGCFLLNRCASYEVSLHSVRLLGVRASDISEKTFSNAMEACGQEGLAAISQTPGGQGSGQPKLAFKERGFFSRREMKKIESRREMNKNES